MFTFLYIFAKLERKIKRRRRTTCVSDCSTTMVLLLIWITITAIKIINIITIIVVIIIIIIFVMITQSANERRLSCGLSLHQWLNGVFFGESILPDYVFLVELNKLHIIIIINYTFIRTDYCYYYCYDCCYYYYIILFI